VEGDQREVVHVWSPVAVVIAAGMAAPMARCARWRSRARACILASLDLAGLAFRPPLARAAACARRARESEGIFVVAACRPAGYSSSHLELAPEAG